MTLPFDEDDPVLGLLRALPPVDVPARRAEAIRRRGQRELARATSRRADGAPTVGRPWWRWFEPAIVSGLAAAFLVEVVRRAAALY